ncbi:hypothetical protein LTR47_011626 [Exophiala xenobiotica]|nr:hypothetical protein LTR72_011658 [Exophiala xenobiotica]KAK5218870.1 hypothetical protein LTR47_011626 [Exophiala xenobiotica]KAK5243336.1 hypothetical protein LTS06_010880 [Exophiala xenobiotica]KAK5260189.1 hypothetical protein LTR40_004608 [Exophiala xenobiotica]KAK5284709.1 hypothetical protein LTR14_011556 [Exophiala xenobiotica]
MTWEELSTAVSTWKINADESRQENEIETSRKPYSVLKILARHDGNGRRWTKGTTKKSPRQNLFDQEITAEGQARVEITEYLDSLVDHAEHEEAHACVWPLEDCRREGWAKEMVAAYPKECAVFVENVNENSRGRVRDRQLCSVHDAWDCNDVVGLEDAEVYPQDRRPRSILQVTLYIRQLGSNFE